MKQQAKITINIQGNLLGGERSLICVPLMAAEERDIIREAEVLAALLPDVVEWRADGFDGVENIDSCMRILNRLRNILPGVGLVFTCRTSEEGGSRKLPREYRLELNKAAIDSNCIDLLDTELVNGEDYLREVRSCAEAKNVNLIISHHNFIQTPDEESIISILKKEQLCGADVVKIAVMPRCYDDVLTLLSATAKARQHHIAVPMIAISMGEMGKMSRLAGGCFGSDLTFAVGTNASAPGQIAIEPLRNGLTALE
ncbi:MAG: type I 3-dehydroquinate dehydratase [Desulfobacterales bacterium]|nr:MAG: type I 3-dehydroquinate dehydratase [Desulfobacterales bacterium]